MPPKKSTKTHKEKSDTDIKLEKALIENFIALQKVMTNLSVRFDNLSDRINKLLDLFEISAKALAEKEANMELGNNKEVIDKLSNLEEQNKVIAKGITLLHERGPQPTMSQMNPQFKPNIPQNGVAPEGYQGSIMQREGKKLQRV